MFNTCSWPSIQAGFEYNKCYPDHLQLTNYKARLKSSKSEFYHSSDERIQVVNSTLRQPKWVNSKETSQAWDKAGGDIT